MNFNRQKFLDKGWVNFSLHFDFDNKIIELTIDGAKMKAAVVSLPSSLSPQIVFGRFDYLIDVPSIAIRNLCILGGEKEYYFPLSRAMIYILSQFSSAGLSVNAS